MSQQHEDIACGCFLHQDTNTTQKTNATAKMEALEPQKLQIPTLACLLLQLLKHRSLIRAGS